MYHDIDLDCDETEDFLVEEVFNDEFEYLEEDDHYWSFSAECEDASWD